MRQMRLARVSAVLTFIVPLACQANDFPTSGRVEYVLECMKNHDGKQEYLYKCSCVVDQIAQRLKYDEYVEISTSERYQTLGGERGAVFRDPQNVRQEAKKYRSIQDAAKKACFAG